METEPTIPETLPSAPLESGSVPALLTYRRASLLANAPDNCYRCGYPLLGIADDQACPECGLLARRSRRVTDELHDTRPRWLARISRGANLILLAIVIACAWPLVWGGAYDIVMPRVGYGRMRYVVPWLGVNVAAVLLAVGAWLMTGREGYLPADRADRRLRLSLRLAACVPLLAMAVGIVRAFISLFVGFIGFRTVSQISDVLSYVVAFLATVGCAPLPLLLFLHLRGLAKRARSAHLAEHCLIVGIGTSTALLFATAYAVVSNNAEALGLGTHWNSRSSVAMALTLTIAVAAVLFAMWSIYLFVRFAMSFRRAAQELRGKWTADDRSLAPTSISSTLESRP